MLNEQQKILLANHCFRSVYDLGRKDSSDDEWFTIEALARLFGNQIPSGAMGEIVSVVVHKWLNGEVMIPGLNECCIQKVHNWKFEAAYSDYLKFELKNRHEDEQKLLKALAESFGNPGWFYGNMGTLVSCCVNYMTGEKIDDGEMILWNLT